MSISLANRQTGAVTEEHIQEMHIGVVNASGNYTEALNRLGNKAEELTRYRNELTRIYESIVVPNYIKTLNDDKKNEIVENIDKLEKIIEKLEGEHKQLEIVMNAYKNKFQALKSALGLDNIP